MTTYLWTTDLNVACLQGADISSHRLRDANLSGVNLYDFIFTRATLPLP
ncbi:MAG: pentapeptide repeat-containing protein [Trichodesmium sp.]